LRRRGEAWEVAVGHWPLAIGQKRAKSQPFGIPYSLAKSQRPKAKSYLLWREALGVGGKLAQLYIQIFGSEYPLWPFRGRELG
jgi:hypothetical protein